MSPPPRLSYPVEDLGAHKDSFCTELRTHGFATIRLPDSKREMVGITEMIRDSGRGRRGQRAGEFKTILQSYLKVPRSYHPQYGYNKMTNLYEACGDFFKLGLEEKSALGGKPHALQIPFPLRPSESLPTQRKIHRTFLPGLRRVDENIIGYKNTGNREFLELHIDDAGVPCPYPFEGDETG
jgi:hypothetical protein